MDNQASAPYSMIEHMTVRVGQEQVELITKPGLPDWSLVSPSVNLFVDNASIKSMDCVLLMGVHVAAPAAYLSRCYPQTQLSLTDHNHTSLKMGQQTLAANEIQAVKVIPGVDLAEVTANSVNVVYIQLPKGRLLARRWLVQAHHALALEGSLYLAGSNQAGIQSVISDAKELFGNGSLLAYKKGNRIARFIRKADSHQTPEWAQAPGIAPDSWVEFSIELGEHKYLIRSLPGVFSYDRLDEGTRLLLEVIQIPRGGKVLDVGCGYGVIGLYAGSQGAGTVHMVDNDLLAVASCNATLAVNNIHGPQVLLGDLLEPVSGHAYDLILSNPPFHAGHAVDYHAAHALIEQSHHALNPGGRLAIVANRFIRYDRLIKSIYGNVDVVADSGKYFVLSGLKFS